MNAIHSRFDNMKTIDLKRLTLDFFNDINSASEESYTVVAVPSGWLIRIWTEYKCVDGSQIRCAINAPSFPLTPNLHMSCVYDGYGVKILFSKKYQ